MPKIALFAVEGATENSMLDRRGIVGVVLAGGKSSRMGTNKAFLSYNQVPLIDHMQLILRNTGLERVLISGSVDGYECIPDRERFQGPVKAIEDIMVTNADVKGFLFVPVDMPLLHPEIFDALLCSPDGGYFEDRPLPIYITAPYKRTNARSIRQMLEELKIRPFNMPETFAPYMKNINTPDEWREVITA